MLALSPAWGSATTSVTLNGEGFSETAEDNRVTFDGHVATVISAAVDQLVVEPSVDTADERFVVVNVEVANQISNGLAFELVPSGTARAVGPGLPTAPTGVVGVGADLYVAAGNLQSPSSGLYRVDANGVVTQLVPAESVSLPTGGGATRILDGPIAVATDGTDVYFVSALGSVMRYVIADGTVDQILAPTLGGGGNAFPGRTGLAFDADGVMYVVDRNLGGTGGVLRIDADGALDGFTDPAFGDGSAAEIVGIASDGTDLFISDSVDGVVIKVTDPGNTFTITDDFATGGNEPFGIAVVGTEVVVSNADGSLSSADAADGGALASFGDAGGYGYRAEGLWSDGADLLLAQAASSAVRRIPDGATDAELVAVGARLQFATVDIGGSLYLAGIGFGLFGGPGSAAAPDGSILRIDPDGTSQLVFESGFPSGMVASGAAEVTVSDCFGRRIFTLDLDNGTTADRLVAADGILCPGDLHLDGNGNLFYTNADIGNPTPSTIGRLTAGGANTLDFVTGLPPGVVTMAVSGTAMFATWIGPGMENGTEVYTADLAASGAASVLVPAARAGGLSALAVSPTGAVVGYRFGLGEVIAIDPTEGAVHSLATTLLPGAALGEGGGAFTFSLGFLADGTAVVPDGGQGALIHVAP